MSRRKGSKAPRWSKALLALLLAAVLSFAVLLGAVESGNRDHVMGDPGVMLILGCQVQPGGPSMLLRDRLDTALAYWKEHPQLLIVVSGGQGADEPQSEAQCMYDYLTQSGVPAEQVWREDESRNTMQNLRNTKALLEQADIPWEKAGLLVVSNGFHLTRVRMLAQRVFGAELSTLAAPSSHAPSRWKMYVREPLALIKSFVVDREGV